MHYLFEHGRFKLYEIEESDGKKPGTTGEEYNLDTVLVFEAVESKIEIGKEVAWARDEKEAAYLAEDITAGTKNIAIDVQMSLADKTIQEIRNLASKKATATNGARKAEVISQDAISGEDMPDAS